MCGELLYPNTAADSIVPSIKVQSPCILELSGYYHHPKSHTYNSTPDCFNTKTREEGGAYLDHNLIY